MKNKKLKTLSLLCLLAPLAACSGIKGPQAPKKIDMTFEEAVALVSSESALANDEGINGYSSVSGTVYNTNQAVYMSLKLTGQDGSEINAADYDSWSVSIDTDNLFTNKVRNSTTKYYVGDGNTQPSTDESYLVTDSATQVRYIADDQIGVFKDAKGLIEDDDGELVPYETHGLDSIWGQKYCDWWDKTYGKFNSAYVGMNTMEGYEESYLTLELTPNTTTAAYIDFVSGYFDDAEEPAEPVVTVDAYEDVTTVSVAVSGDYGSTLGDLCWFDETGNGYEGWVDAEVYLDLALSAQFDTATGVVTSYGVSQVYSLKTNPNTGAEIEGGYVLQVQENAYSDFVKNGEYAGELKVVGDEFDTRYYDIFYLDADHYWFFTFNQGSPCPYQVDLTATKLNKAMTDGFSWSDPAKYNADGTISLNGARGHSYVDEEGATKSIKYTYTFSLDSDGNLVSSYVNEKGETVTETYYSSANFANLAD